jgi:hypothetical protein
MTRAMIIQPLAHPAVRRLPVVIYGFGRPDHLTHPLPLPVGKHLLPSPVGRTLGPPRAEPKTARAIRWLVQPVMLVGFLVGILGLAQQGALIAWPPPDVLRTAACQATISPRVMVFCSGVPPILSHLGKSLGAPVACHMPPPRENLRLCDSDLEDNDPPSIALLIAGGLGLPPPATVMHAPDMEHASPCPTRYLVRPQLLTRL